MPSRYCDPSSSRSSDKATDYHSSLFIPAITIYATAACAPSSFFICMIADWGPSSAGNRYLTWNAATITRLISRAASVPDQSVCDILPVLPPAVYFFCFDLPVLSDRCQDTLALFVLTFVSVKALSPTMAPLLYNGCATAVRDTSMVLLWRWSDRAQATL
jgi:hypothetical protein